MTGMAPKASWIVADPAPQHPLCQSIIEAGRAAGIPASDDFNGARQEGLAGIR